jgi:Protein of unknown function (DUF1236)
MNRLHLATAVLALAWTTGVAAAQGTPPPRGSADPLPGALAPPTIPAQIQLTPEQKGAILTAVKDTKVPPPNNAFTVAVGAQVPPSIELYALPIAALSQAPETKLLRYTMVQNQVVLVDPTNLRIVEVIRP